jgi:AcrR family transcriptional regulator
MSEINETTVAGQRGKADHNIRDQIVNAANEHFSHYGYGKTTVSDLAKAIGFSKAYIYKFFDSKQAIGEAICSSCLDSIIAAVEAEVAVGTSAADKFRRLFKTQMARSVELFFADRKLYDIAVYSISENWHSSRNYMERIQAMLQQIIVEGRESGEFERKTPLDETVRAISLVMQPFTHPLMLQYNLDGVHEGANEVSNLVLRGLAP